MRQLIYLSNAKLESFVDERWRMPRPLKVDGLDLGLKEYIKLRLVRNPDLPGSKFKKPLKQARQFIDDVDRSDSPVLDPGDERITIGRWIQFDAALDYVVTAKAFLAWSAISGSAQRLEDVIDPLLLLHGSTKHVVGGTSMRSYQRHVGGRQRGLIFKSGPGGSEPDVFDFLHRHLTPHLRNKPPDDTDDEPRTMDEIFKTLVHSVYHSSFGTVAGYARVTGIHDIRMSAEDGVTANRRLVAATPLFVERV